MKNNLVKISGAIRIVLIAIAVIIAALFYSDLMSVSDEALMPDQWINGFLKYAYILGISAAVIAILFALYTFVMKLIDSPKKALISLIPIVALVVIVIIAHSNASDMPLNMPNYDGMDNVKGHKNLIWSGAGLFTMYTLLIGAIAAIIVAEIMRIFK